jgi:PAS domain S-box-containing protein
MKTMTKEILLIEDNLADADLIKEMLSEAKGEQYSVEHVQYQVQGLDLLQDRSFDVILLDLGLPDSQGLETVVALRDQEKQTPIIVLTALEDEELALKTLEMGVQDYLFKSEITSSMLKRSIGYAIQRKRAVEQLRDTEQRFAAFMLNLPAAAWMKDSQGRYVYANAEAERVFSMPLTALLGKTDDEIFPPITARQFRENDQRALAEGVTIQTTEVLRQADGIDHHSIVNKFALAGPNGKPVYVAGVALDITERKRMEAELEHFASFPLIDPTPIMEMDSDGRVIFCNRAAEKMLGNVNCLDSSNPLIPANLPDIFRDLHQEKVRQYRRTVEVGDLVFDEMIYLAPQFNSVRIFAIDITERRRLEEDRSRLAAIVESSDDAIIAKTLDGVIVDWNKGAERLYGYTAAEIKGRHISTLIPVDRVDEASRILEKIARGENVEPFETAGVAKDGRQIPVLLAISPIKDSSGRITGAATIVHDITERKRAEQELRETEQKLRNIVEHSTNLFYMHGTDHVLTYVSPQSRQFFDCEPEEALVRWTDLITDNPVNILAIEATQRAIDTGERQPPYQVESIGRTGRKVWVEVHEAPIIEGGRTVAIVGSLTDITERKQAEEKIEELNTNLALANRALEAFNYTVAHDLRKPLTIVNGYCQALKELCGEQLDVHCRAYLQEAYDGTLRMNRLIDALLNFSRMAHVELRREKVDLSGMAQVVAAELSLAEPGRRVDFRIADGVSADGDAALLRVVLENLIGNAWKYTGTRDKGIIEFGTTEVDGKPAFFVRDNGAGFDMADADKIFVPFQRLPGAAEFRGHGIGLATVERIISRHGGRVWTEAKPGEGATFYFTLSVGRV